MEDKETKIKELEKQIENAHNKGAACHASKLKHELRDLRNKKEVAMSKSEKSDDYFELKQEEQRLRRLGKHAFNKGEKEKAAKLQKEVKEVRAKRLRTPVPKVKSPHSVFVG